MSLSARGGTLPLLVESLVDRVDRFGRTQLDADSACFFMYALARRPTSLLFLGLGAFFALGQGLER